MKLWPPQPGLTLIASMRSHSAASPATASAGVPGLIASPARQPASRIAARVRWACGSASRWIVMQSAPAAAKTSTCSAGRSIMRWTSRTPPAACTSSAIDDAISGPIVIGGTKWPSMTSTWITRAPTSITSATCAPSFEKSADRIDGAIRRDAEELCGRWGSYGPEHRVAAMLADHVLGTAEPDDRLVLAAVLARRRDLVALEAEHAAKAPRQVGRAKPRLAAARAGGALGKLGRVLSHSPLPSGTRR